MINLNDIQLNTNQPRKTNNNPKPPKQARTVARKASKPNARPREPDFSEKYLIINNRVPNQGETVQNGGGTKPPTRTPKLKANKDQPTNQVRDSRKAVNLARPNTSKDHRASGKLENVVDFMKKHEFKFLNKGLPKFSKDKGKVLNNNFFNEDVVERGDEAAVTAKKPDKGVRIDEIFNDTPMVKDPVLDKPSLSPIGVDRKLQFEIESLDRHYDKSVSNDMRHISSLIKESKERSLDDKIVNESADGFERVEGSEVISVKPEDENLDSSFESVEGSEQELGFREDEIDGACEALPNQTTKKDDLVANNSKIGDKIIHELYAAKLMKKKQANEEIKARVKNDMESIFSIFKTSKEL